MITAHRPSLPKFLSTPSARRATVIAIVTQTDSQDFYPRPPRGGRRCSPASESANLQFLSTPSARRATKATRLTSRATRISIHALREEGDAAGRANCSRRGNFYPRPPRGGRPCRRAASSCLLDHFYPRPPRGGRPRTSSSPRRMVSFLSTPSARRATQRNKLHGQKTLYFYPRPPRGGRQNQPFRAKLAKSYFYPRPPRGGRPPSGGGSPSQCQISIHALREEGDI